MAIKKLIEVALPLDKINEASAREKSIRHGHPTTLHLYWARRPLAAARAVIWASLVDDPSSHPELFPTEDAQNKERQRLFKILENLVVWENSNNTDVLNVAKKEILRWTNNNPPQFLDPFAGGGAIPFEAQRLGLASHAHDLNPLAVLINKAMIEIPPKFANLKPVNPNANWITEEGCYAKGLAGDVAYYGQWMKKEAFKKIGHLYPKVMLKGYGEMSVIAWIWARTVKCPNPVCGCEMPLASSFVISTKKGNEAWVEPVFENGSFRYIVHRGLCEKERSTYKIGRSAVFKCPHCGEVTTDEYVKGMGLEKKLGSRLIAIVAEGSNGRVYLSPTPEQEIAANVSRPEQYPDGAMPDNPRWFSPPAFGMKNYSDLFTNRQLTALLTFSDLVHDAQKMAEKDALNQGFSNDETPLSEGGLGAKAYGEAVGVYLSFVIDRLADRCSTLCGWDVGYSKINHTFGRQAVRLVWDYAEGNPFSSSTGSISSMFKWITEVLENLSPADHIGIVNQFNAQHDCGLRNLMISTDPPYYDNIGYADLSDYFYIWMRQGLKNTYPRILSTALTPKTEELIATPYRFNGSMQKAKSFFEHGMIEACKRLYDYSVDEIPVTIYYAYKQSKTVKKGEDSKTSSSGWETMLSAIVSAGFSITGTWPMRTELTTGLKGDKNALASSIVLVCRKRPEDAPTTTRRNFIQELKRELKSSLQKLQSSNIAPVDMAQSAIGPGMGVFSKYAQVLEADGTPMSVRSALQIINQELDLYFNEQDGELDSNSRFCVDFYTQYGFNDAKFGDADTLARAKNTSVATLQSKGVIIAEKGVAHLVDRGNLPEKVDFADNMVWLFTQRLTRAMSTGGIKACASLIHNVHSSLPEQAKALAYRLHSIAERKGWQEEAFAYNSLVIAWTDIQMAAANIHEREKDQIEMDI